MEEWRIEGWKKYGMAQISWNDFTIGGLMDNKQELLNEFIAESKLAYTPKFQRMSYALADSMTTPILAQINNSEVRRSMTILDSNMIRKGAGANSTWCLAGFGQVFHYNDEVMEIMIPTFAVTAADQCLLSKISQEVLQRKVNRIAEAIIRFEKEQYDLLVEESGSKDIGIYIKESYLAHDDPSLLRKRMFGIFGWETIGLVTL